MKDKSSSSYRMYFGSRIRRSTRPKVEAHHLARSTLYHSSLESQFPHFDRRDGKEGVGEIKRA